MNFIGKIMKKVSHRATYVRTHVKKMTQFYLLDETYSDVTFFHISKKRFIVSLSCLKKKVQRRCIPFSEFAVVNTIASKIITTH